MIKEDYVSFKIAKLLKEKGFNSDKENIETIKQMFETNKKLNEFNGCAEAAKVIEVFKKVGLTKLKFSFK